MNTIVSPSILSADFSRLGEECRMIEKCGADWIHFDVMDGIFVPNITLGMKALKDIRGSSSLPFDVHLMICDPIKYVAQFVKCGADIVTFHVEAAQNIVDTIRAIKSAGAKVGLALKPSTPISAIAPYLDNIDMALVMTVEPGFGGQKLIASTVSKVKQLHNLKPNFLIEVDGGIDTSNVAILKEAGANIIVAGSAVFKAEDRAEIISLLKNL
ncbi:MAG: ribulose-phosphate 3-epimerase [Corallococcus sp.]|nr:ribulose-phosphate 3-epimerase [Corallococcus sp.]